MQKIIVAALAAGAFACSGLASAHAADFPVPQASEPPPDYGPPPYAESYDYPPPPPVAYGVVPPPPPDVYVYDAPVYAVAPGPFYGPYWRGVGPNFAYGYGRRGGRWGGGRGWHR